MSAGGLIFTFELAGSLDAAGFSTAGKRLGNFFALCGTSASDDAGVHATNVASSQARRFLAILVDNLEVFTLRFRADTGPLGTWPRHYRSDDRVNDHCQTEAGCPSQPCRGERIGRTVKVCDRAAELLAKVVVSRRCKLRPRDSQFVVKPDAGRVRLISARRKASLPEDARAWKGRV